MIMKYCAICLLIAASSTVTEGTSITIEGVTDDLSFENEQYAPALLAAQSAFQEAQRIFGHSDFYSRKGWRKEYETRDGYMVFSRIVNGGSRMFAISEILEAPAADVIREMWKPTGTAANNPVASMKPVVTLSPYADIVKFTSPSFAESNMVRIYRPVPMPMGAIDGYIAAFRPIDLPDEPLNNTSPLPTISLSAVRLNADISRARRAYLDVVVIIDLKGNQDRAFARQTASTAIAMLSEQAVRQFSDRTTHL